MDDFINNYFNYESKSKRGHDIILTMVFERELEISYRLKLIQMKLGKLYEELAEKYFGFIKVKKIDLIHPKRRVAVELKASDNTDNSSSRYRNYEKLLEFKSDYKLYYLCINCTTKKPQRKILDNGITLLTGNFALEFLYGKDYQLIIDSIISVLKEKQRHLQIAGTPSTASSTTSILKDLEGSQLIADLDSKKLEDMVEIRSQAPKSQDMEKVQRLDGGGRENA